MLPMPDIRELRAVLALIQAGGFAGAADALGITQPAVSARIAKLEQTLGFSVFHRRADGTELTAEGRALLPCICEFDEEFSRLTNKVSYCKRAAVKEVRVFADASRISCFLRDISSSDARTSELCAHWKEIGADDDWMEGLLTYEADILLSGSFLGEGECESIKTLPILRQAGLTVAWNPDYHSFSEKNYSFPDVIASTAILPAESFCRGFRAFIDHWCKNSYGFQLSETIVVNSEDDAVVTCRHGMGVLVLPGDAERRLKLRSLGLVVAHSFKTVLPAAYTYGIRYRSEERNPAVLEAVKLLHQSLSLIIGKPEKP